MKLPGFTAAATGLAALVMACGQGDVAVQTPLPSPVPAASTAAPSPTPIVRARFVGQAGQLEERCQTGTATYQIEIENPGNLPLAFGYRVTLVLPGSPQVIEEGPMVIEAGGKVILGQTVAGYVRNTPVRVEFINGGVPFDSREGLLQISCGPAVATATPTAAPPPSPAVAATATATPPPPPHPTAPTPTPTRVQPTATPPPPPTPSPAPRPTATAGQSAQLYTDSQLVAVMNRLYNEQQPVSPTDAARIEELARAQEKMYHLLTGRNFKDDRLEVRVLGDADYEAFVPNHLKSSVGAMVLTFVGGGNSGQLDRLVIVVRAGSSRFGAGSARTVSGVAYREVGQAYYFLLRSGGSVESPFSNRSVKDFSSENAGILIESMQDFFFSAALAKEVELGVRVQGGVPSSEEMRANVKVLVDRKPSNDPFTESFYQGRLFAWYHALKHPQAAAVLGKTGKLDSAGAMRLLHDVGSDPDRFTDIIRFKVSNKAELEEPMYRAMSIRESLKLWLVP